MFRSPRPVFFFNTILTALCAFAVPPYAAAERLALRTYGVADGLPQEGVKHIVRDSHGFLWFCTYDGLSRFDGTRFVNYGVQDGLPHPSANFLLESRSGVYLIATNGGGIARFDPSRSVNPASDGQSTAAHRTRGATPAPRRLFTSYAVGGTSATSRVNVLYEDRAGRIWAGTDDGLFVADGPQALTAFRPIDLPFGKPLQVWALLEDRGGDMWVATSDGLALRVSDGRTRIVRTESGERVTVWRLAQDEEDRLWIGSSTGLRVVPRTAAGLSPAGSAQINGRISALKQSRSGVMWVGTFAGDVFAVDRQGTRPVLHLDDIITSLAEDHDGNLWISTVRGPAGVTRLARHGFTRYDEADGLSKGPLGGIFETKAGELSVLRQDRLHRFDGQRFIEVKPRFEMPAVMRSFLQDRQGETWIATDRGVFRFAARSALADLADLRPAARYQAADAAAGANDDVVLAFDDSHGDIWIGTKGPTTLAVLRRAPGGREVFSGGRGLPAAVRWPLAAAEDRGGNIWIGFREGGLVRYRHGRFDSFSEGRELPHGEVLALFLDHAGRLWIADGAGSLLRIDDPTAPIPSVERYTTAQGLASDMVRCVTEDVWGRVYVGTARGVDRLDLANGNITHYSTADGLPGEEVSRAFRDRDGVLWFGSWGGVSRFRPERDRESAAPSVFISAIRTGAGPLPISDMGERSLANLTLGPDEGQLAIEYFGLDVAEGDRLRFEYRLDGADTGWNPPTTLRSVNYAHLSPGTYRFLVRILTPAGARSDAASVSFRILKPVWLRAWFLASAAGVCLALGTLLYRYRVAQLLAIERVRTRIATDLHDDIGASLSQIAILSEVVRGESDTRPESANTLARIATISRELVESMGDIVWAINPKRDRSGDLLQRMRHYARDTLTGRDIGVSFRTPEFGQDVALGTDVRREVLLIFKEAVNNVVQHARCGQVDVDVQISPDGLVLRVADDGAGLPPASALESGHGLVSMRERARRLGGALEVNSDPGLGTAVTLRIPLRRASHTYLST